jgi:hypothetical protein
LFSRLGKELMENPDLVSGNGQLAAKMQEYRTLASDYLLEYDDGVYTRMAINEWMQADSREGIQERFRQQAKKRYSHLGDLLDQGITVKQAMLPMTNAVARTLEMSPDQVNLNEARWRELVEFDDPDSGKRRTMTTSEAERWARRQDEFQYTAMAREETYSMATALLETMGAIA